MHWHALPPPSETSPLCQGVWNAAPPVCRALRSRQTHPEGPSRNCRRSCVKAASCPLPTQRPAPSTSHRRTVRLGAEAAFPRSPGGRRRWPQHSERRSSAPPLYRADFGPGHSLSSNALGRPLLDTIRESGVAPACPSPVLEFCRMLTLQPWELWSPRRGLPQSCYFPRDGQARVDEQRALPRKNHNLPTCTKGPELRAETWGTQPFCGCVQGRERNELSMPSPSKVSRTRPALPAAPSETSRLWAGTS